MITRYNTNRDATRQFIGGSTFLALILAIAPPALVYTATNVPTTTAIAVTYIVFHGCAIMLFGFCVYRYVHWSEQDDAYLLSERTLAIVGPGRPVRFIRPRDIVALRRDGMRLILADGTPLRLPHLPVRPGTSALPHAIVTTWFGKEFLDNANNAYRNTPRRQSTARSPGRTVGQRGYRRSGARNCTSGM